MNTRTSITLAIVAGFGLGGLTVHTLHAQAKPPAFTVVEIDVHDLKGYEKDYAPKARELIKAKGGKLIAVSNNVVAIEGQGAKRLAIQQWASIEAAKGWAGSKEYAENRKVGNKYAKFRILAVEGVPQQ